MLPTIVFRRFLFFLLLVSFSYSPSASGQGVDPINITNGNNGTNGNGNGGGAPSPTPTCPEGYKFVQPIYCIKTTTEEPIRDCPGGSVLVGHECIREETYPARPFCPINAMLDERRNICRVRQITAADVNCPSGYQTEGKTCVKVEPVPAVTQCPAGYGLSVPSSAVPPAPPPPAVVRPKQSYSSVPYQHEPVGHTRSGYTGASQADFSPAVHRSSFASSASFSPSPSTTSYSSSTSFPSSSSSSPYHGYRRLGAVPNPRAIGNLLENRECVRRTASKPELGCAPGFLRDGGLCTQKEKADALGSCPQGFDMLDGTDCARLLPANPIPHCDDDYKLEGLACVKHSFVKAAPSCTAGGRFDGHTCRAEKIAVVEMRCPDLYELDRQTGKCIRVLERDPVPFCEEGFKLEKAAKLGGDKVVREKLQAQHPKTGVFHVDHVCYHLNVSPPEWVCPPNGALAVNPNHNNVNLRVSGGDHSGGHGHHSAGRRGANVQKKKETKKEPECAVADKLQPLLLCPPGSEASQDGQCIVRQTIQMRYECQAGFRIDPQRRQCFKNVVAPLTKSCKRGELKDDRCVEVEIAPPRIQCPENTHPAKDNKSCVKKDYAEPVFTCANKKGRRVAVGQHQCEGQIELPAKMSCEDEDEQEGGKGSRRRHGGKGDMNGEGDAYEDSDEEGDSNEVHTVVYMDDGVCVKELSMRPDIRCREGFLMGLDHDCVKIETADPEFSCPEGYTYVPGASGEQGTCQGGDGNGSGNGSVVPLRWSSSGSRGRWDYSRNWRSRY